MIHTSGKIPIPAYEFEQRTANAEYAPRDGAEAVLVGDRLYMLGGWDPSNPAFTGAGWYAGTTNEIWYSDNLGTNWTMVLPHDSTTTNRWKPRHEFGVVQFGGFVYVVGGDNNSGMYARDVWRASESDLSSWQLVTPDWGLGDRVLYSTWIQDNAIYIAGGQTLRSLTIDPGPDTYFTDVWKSADNGATFQRITNTAPLALHNACGRRTRFAGRMWFHGGGKYKVAFSNSVHSTSDGITFFAHDNAPWDPRYYLDFAQYDGRFWVIAGHSNVSRYGEPGGSDPSGLTGYNRGDIWHTVDGLEWIPLATPDHDATATPQSHASTIWSTRFGIIFGAGNHLTKQVWRIKKAGS